MKQKFAKILQEHERCSIHLIFLKDAVRRIITYGVNSSDIIILYDALEFIMKDVQEHYNFEENNIYPYLVKFSSGEMIGELIIEHDLIMRTTKELKEFLDEVEVKGLGEIALIILKDKSKLVAELLSKHISKENDLLYKAARQIFTERDFHYLYKARKESV